MKNKVLLIDDSVTIHRVIDLSIDLEKYDLVKVFTQEAAFSKLKELNFDFILIDNKLENTNMSNYTQEIKGLQPMAKLIMLVGAFDKIDDEYLLNLGADDYLAKPFDSQSLNIKLTLSDKVKNIKAEQAAKIQENVETEKTEDENINNIYCEIAQKPQMESMFASKPQESEEDTAQNDWSQQSGITKPVNNMPIFHDPSEDPPKSAGGGKQVQQLLSKPLSENEDGNKNQKNEENVSEFEKKDEPALASFDTFTTQEERIKESQSEPTSLESFQAQSETKNDEEIYSTPFDYDTPQQENNNKNEIGFKSFDAFTPETGVGEEKDIPFQKENLFNYDGAQESPPEQQQTRESFGGVGSDEQTDNNGYQDFVNENRFKQITDEHGQNVEGMGEDGKPGNQDYLDFRGENSFKQLSSENTQTAYTPPNFDDTYTPPKLDEENQITEPAEKETEKTVNEQNAGQNEILVNENTMQNHSQSDTVNNEPENTPEKEKEAIKMINDNIKTQTEEENNDSDFYQLNEDDIFNSKPVGQLFETEILSIATPKEEKENKNEEDKPLAQKFEEEVLSIDEPTPEKSDYSSPAETIDDKIFEPAKIEEPTTIEAAAVEEIPKKEEYKKSISQKFEEEILSIEDPAENQFNLENSDSQTKLNETFDNEILLIGDPEERTSAKLHDDEPEEPDEDLQRLENELFAKIKTTYNVENAPQATPVEDKNEQDKDIFGAREFMKEIDSPIPSKNDDFFQDKSLVKEFADDIFPKDETDEEFNFGDILDNSLETKNIDDDLFVNKNESFEPNDIFKDDDLFTNKNESIEPNDIFKDDDLFTNKNESFEPNDIFKDDDLFTNKNESFEPNDIFKEDDLFTSKNESAPAVAAALPDDDSLDLDALLNMDLSKPQPQPKPQAEPQVRRENIEKTDNFSQQTSKPNKPVDIENLDDDLFAEAESVSVSIKSEDPFANISDISSNIDTFIENEDLPFDVVEMENSKVAKIQNNFDSDVLSGITVTISKEEIMKMIGNALDKNFLEKAVQDVLAQNMREIVRSVVPAIAEKFIKEEIEKLKDDDEDI